VFKKYDSEDTVFYCDPPYVGSEGYPLVNTIDHEALVDGLAELEVDWICPYEDLPAGFEVEYVLDRDGERFINSGKRGEAKDAKEPLVIKFESERP